MARKRLGEFLLQEGLIDQQQLSQALHYQERSGYRLGTALVALRLIAEWQLTAALARLLQLPVVDPAISPPSQEALDSIPVKLAERFDLLPIRFDGEPTQRQLVVAMSDPLNKSAIRRLQEVTGCAIQPSLCGLSDIQRAIRRYYRDSEPSEVVHAAEQMVLTNEAPLPPLVEKAIANLGTQELTTSLEFKALLRLLIEKKLISEHEYSRSLSQELDRM